MEIKRLIRPGSCWHWAAYLLCLAILVWIGWYSGRVSLFDGDDLNMALGVHKALNGVTPLHFAYRFATAVGLYYPLYFLAGLGFDPLTVFVCLSLAAAFAFVGVFSLFAARLTGSHVSYCLLALLSQQEVIAAFLYANDMAIGMFFISCGLTIQLFRPRFWLPLTLLCAATAVCVRIDLIQIIPLHVILNHFHPGAGPVQHLKLLKTDLAFCVLIPAAWVLILLSSSAGLLHACSTIRGHISLYLGNYYHYSFVTMESFRSLTGFWLVPASLGLLWLAWDRKILPCLLVIGFCLAGLLLVLPFTTSPKYLLPHLAIATLGIPYALDRLLSGRYTAQALGAVMVGSCLLFPLVGNPTLHKLNIGPLSLEQWHMANLGDTRLISIGTGRVLDTHDGVRLSGGYLFLPPLVDLIKRNYVQVRAGVDQWLDRPGTPTCFSNSGNWVTGSLVEYALLDRGYRRLGRGVWGLPGKAEVVILNDKLKEKDKAADCTPMNTYRLDCAPRLPVDDRHP